MTRTSDGGKPLPAAPMVQLQGIRRLADDAVLDRLDAMAGRALDRLASEFRVEHFALHFKVYRSRPGSSVKYSVKAHLSTGHELISAQADGWDVVGVTEQALRELGRRAVERKAKERDRRRAGATGAGRGRERRPA